MLDVHPPHEKIHGIRDFFLHLFTITVGLFIALGLEGCIERAHQRNLVHEAEASLRTEIADNSKAIANSLAEVQKQQETIKHDVEILRYIAANHKAPADASMEINFRVHGLDDVAWKTAQATASLSFMPYTSVQEYADIYATQEKFNAAEIQAVRDASVSVGPFISSKKGDPDPTAGEADEVRRRLEVLAGQLVYVQSLLESLQAQYNRFLSHHPA